MFCAISGEPPQEPVVSVKSGHVYEKRLILKYIAENGRDPITGEDISEDDLVVIKASPKTVKPRPPTLTSIPSLLSAFQNEWDSLMLETFTLKQQYQQVRQELSFALYQHDAACRVIAKLMKERDSARDALANVQAHINIQPVTSADAAVPDGQAMDIEEETSGISERVIEKLTETCAALSKGRKKRKPPPDLTSPKDIQLFTQISHVPSLHKTNPPGIACLDLDQTEKFVITGGNDKTAIIYEREEAKTLATLKGHTKKITDVLWRGGVTGDQVDTAFTASADHTVKIWQPSATGKGYSVVKTLSVHARDVTGIALHATRDYLVSVSLDSTWAFHDIETGSTLVKQESSEVQNGYSTVEFHPDGLILGTGTIDSTVRIWDMKSQKNVTSFDSHTGRITSLAFSENGYYLATASEDNLVKLWDLRKLQNFKTITLEEDAKINKVGWDFSGQYLAVGGTDLRIYQAKTWNELVVLRANSADITDFKFGELAKVLVVGGLDRHLRFFGVASEE